MVDLKPTVDMLRKIRDDAELRKREIEAETEALVAMVLKERQSVKPAKGTPIAIGGPEGAVERYGIDGQTVRNWHARGLVDIIQEGRRGKGGAALYDEHDIATVIEVLGGVTREGMRTDLRLAKG